MFEKRITSQERFNTVLRISLWITVHNLACCSPRQHCWMNKIGIPIHHWLRLHFKIVSQKHDSTHFSRSGCEHISVPYTSEWPQHHPLMLNAIRPGKVNEPLMTNRELTEKSAPLTEDAGWRAVRRRDARIHRARWIRASRQRIARQRTKSL